MPKRTLLIILLILVSVGCVAPKASVTESIILLDGDEAIRREHDLKTGLVKSSSFYDKKLRKYVPGIKAECWICDGEITDKIDPTKDQRCRQLVDTLEFYGKLNQDYDCGGWGCGFWPLD